MVKEFITEPAENYEPRCCCVLVLDVSGSMEGVPIKELNDGLKEFYLDIQTDTTTADRLEVAIIEFSDTVKTLVQPSLAANFDMPILTTKGTTKLVDGVREGIEVVRSRKAWYKQTGQPFYRPWVILITDGAPDKGQDVNGLAVEIKDAVAKKDFFFFAIGVEGADMNILTTISDQQMPPAKLLGLKFSQFFRWLTASMSTVTNSKDGDKVTFEDPNEWLFKPFEILSAKGCILYDIPDSMGKGIQHTCIVRIAENEMIVINNNVFSEAVKVGPISISRVMKAELIEISEYPNFKINPVCDAEQLIEENSFTEWLFLVTPLQSGIFDLVLKISVMKSVEGKEQRKNLVFQKKINVTIDNAAIQNNLNLKDLSKEKNIFVSDAPAVFISYAHKDKVYFDIVADRLKSHSTWFIWTDRHIEIGRDWFERIKNAIYDSDFAVLLVSADFINSVFIEQNEMAEFKKLKQAKKEFSFIPVLLRDVDYIKSEELSGLQFFVAYGDEYGLPNMKGEIIPFAKLCHFYGNEQLLPNDYIETYFKNLVQKIDKDWIKRKFTEKS